MERNGHAELHTDYHRLRVVTAGGVRPIIYTGPVPHDWLFATVPALKPDTARIKTALERGEKLDFAYLGELKKRVAIK
jgi:hypothetical protein